jgi:hypothetical protein
MLFAPLRRLDRLEWKWAGSGAARRSAPDAALRAAP